MKVTSKIAWGAVLTLFLFTAGLQAHAEEITKTFSKKESIRLKTSIGSLRLQKSSDDKIHVHFVYRGPYPEDVEPEFDERGNRLYLSEDIYRNRDFKGSIHWKIQTPDNIEIRFKSGTGNFDAQGLTMQAECESGTGNIQATDCRGEFDMSSGTGGVRVEKCQGEFDLSSGTGRVTVEDSKGRFEASSGTGRVEVYGITVEDRAEFSSGTGDARVNAPQGSDYKLSVKSGTGDALLNLDGQPLQGYFEFTADADRGDIVCPVKFDREDEYWRGDDRYMEKSFTKGKDTPKFFIKTGTGDAELKLK